MSDITQGANSAPASTPATADNGGSASATPSAAEMLAWDPFGPADETGKVSSEPKPTETQNSGDASGTQGGTTPAAAKAPTPAPTPAPTDPNAAQATPPTPAPATQADLQAFIQQQTAALKEALAPAQAQPTQSEAPAPKYNLALPPQIVAGLRSEDDAEFSGAMNTIVNGLANQIYNDAAMMIQQVVLQHVPQMIQQHTKLAKTQEQSAGTFFGRHKTLDNPLLKPVIHAAGLAVAQLRQQAGKTVDWSDEVGDEIAEYIYTQMPQLRPAAATPAPAAPAAARKPPFAAGASARPANGADPSDEFIALLR